VRNTPLLLPAVPGDDEEDEAKVVVPEEEEAGAREDENDGDDRANSELLPAAAKEEGKADEIALDSSVVGAASKWAAGEESERWKKGADMVLAAAVLFVARSPKPGGARMCMCGAAVEEWVRCRREAEGQSVCTVGGAGVKAREEENGVRTASACC